MDQWTPRVTARAELASALKTQYLNAAIAAGIKPADLDVVITQGNLARQADIEQKEQLASIAVERGQRKEQAADLNKREDILRDRLPAVVGHLNDSNRTLAAFLTTLSFARFRYRELAPTPPAPNAPAAPTPAAGQPDPEELRQVTRVPREDIVTRAGSLSAFCRALCKPGREAIVAELAERGLSVDWLNKLADDADAMAKAGRNVTQAAAATAREADAAAAQKAKWNQIKRMVRKAVAGVAVLESKYAEC